MNVSLLVKKAEKNKQSSAFSVYLEVEYLLRHPKDVNLLYAP
jgi:hypothetical protein